MKYQYSVDQPPSDSIKLPSSVALISIKWLPSGVSVRFKENSFEVLKSLGYG
jgi:hypothetical protein